MALSQAFSLTVRLLRTLSPSRLINLFQNTTSYYLSRLIGKPIMWGLPWSLSVEPTTSCNLHCPECPSGLRQFTRPGGQLDFDLFRKIVDENNPHLIYLNLYFQGEPFLNRNLLKMAQYARKKHIIVSTSTNGHFLSDTSAKEVVESGLDRLIISIDGLDQETYAVYRKGGDLATVKQGVSNLIKWKKVLHSKFPVIEIQFLVLGSNQHQIQAFRQEWNKLDIDRLAFKSAQLYHPENNPFLTTETDFSRYTLNEDRTVTIKNALPNHCYRMWHSAVVTWDGRIVPCCFDKDAEHQLGDISINPLSTIWKGSKYRTFRMAVFTDRKNIAICRNCTEGLRYK